MDLNELIETAMCLREKYGNEEVFVDSNLGALCEIEDVDVGGSDEGVVIWLK